jgi:hypothetical protein
MTCRHVSWPKTVLAAACWLAPSITSYAANSAEQLSQLDQADVYAQRTLSQLRRDLIEAEDRFYAEYNELNDNDEFDVNCQHDPRTGSRLVLRICRAVYQEEAIRDSSKEGMETQQRFQDECRNGTCSAPRTPPVPAGVFILAREPDFKRNMRTVVSRSRVLRRLLEERAQAQARLEAAQAATRDGATASETRQIEIPAGSSGK